MSGAIRLAVIGDLQYEDGMEQQVYEAFCDIRSLSPNVVIILGDYGRGCELGTGKGMDTVSRYLGVFDNTIVIPMIGNHDLQLESGKNILPHGTTAQHYKNTFGCMPENRVLEFDSFRVFTVNVDVQPDNDCVTAQECYVSDESFRAIKEKIAERPGVPIIVCTHAPPICSGLQTVPAVHVRASNAFLDQNHSPARWTDLVNATDEIVMWFSGHFHIGHNYKRSISSFGKTTFFTTAVATSYSRDGQRQSRIIDIDGCKATVKTFDHRKKTLLPDSDWYCSDITKPQFSNGHKKVFHAGCGAVVKMQTGKNGRIYSMTDNGYLWEIDMDFCEAMGTLHYSKKHHLEDFFIEDSGVICVVDGKGYLHRYDDKDRFVREYDENDNYPCVGERTVDKKQWQTYCILDNGSICAALESNETDTPYIILGGK